VAGRERDLVITVGPSPGKGRGVFASRAIRVGEIIEEAPVIVLPGAEIEHLERTVLQDYYFLWGPDEKDAAILLGLCSLCNHSFQPNAVFELRAESQTIRFVALRDIAAGEELTTNYNGDPANSKPVWFDARP
jgi:SET domain-containing protein